MTIEYQTVKNSSSGKPNEDAYFVDKANLVFSVIDGVSRSWVGGVYPNPSPTLVLVENILDYLLYTESKSRYNSQLDLLVDLNLYISEVNETFEDKFKPGIAIVSIKIINNIIYWAAIGDCFGLVQLKDGNFYRFNTSQTFKLAYALAQSNSPYMLTTDEIRFNICNNPEHPLAYGVLNGNPMAEKLIESGSLELENISGICLYSDGLAFFDPKDIFSMSMEEIFTTPSPYGDKEHEDDKTLIRLTL